MRQIVWAVQSFLTKTLLWTTIFLIIPTIACSQVITPPGEEDKKVPSIEKDDKDKTLLDLFGTKMPKPPMNEGPPYGTIVMLQKPIACNDTDVVLNFIQNMGGMKPVTFGMDLNEMGAITSLIQVYANPTNKQFAILEHFAAQKSCILVQGHGFDIILPEKKEILQ